MLSLPFFASLGGRRGGGGAVAPPLHPPCAPGPAGGFASIVRSLQLRLAAIEHDAHRCALCGACGASAVYRRTRNHLSMSPTNAGDEGALKHALATLNFQKILPNLPFGCALFSSSMRFRIIVRPASRDPASLIYAIPFGKYQQNSISPAKRPKSYAPSAGEYALLRLCLCKFFLERGGVCYEINSLFM